MPYSRHDLLKEPLPTQQLWRHIGLEKFIAMLQNKSLYFPSLHQLASIDPWEGFPSKLNLRPDRIVRVQKENKAKTMTLSKLLGEQQAESYLKLEKTGYINKRKTIYVNCCT